MSLDIAASEFGRNGSYRLALEGSFNRSERMAKWNECLRIQDVLGADAFVGGAPMANTWWGKKYLKHGEITGNTD